MPDVSLSIIDELLERHQDKLDTRAIMVQREAIENCLPLLDEYLIEGPWLVCVDENTWEVAGERLAAVLDEAGREWSRFDVEKHADEKYPMCDDKRIEQFRFAMHDGNFVSAIAVGAGTINDIVKMAAYRLDKPMACVGTAPSMNGFTSAISAILSDGVKTTQPCAAPKVVIADLDVMAEAPHRMIQSGLGDLISKPVSNSDWALSSILNDTPHSAEAMEIIEAGAAMLDGVAEKLPERDRDATAGLVGSLMLSGLAMSVAGSSSPASGGEHLISHYIDMTAHAYDLPYDFHGCQVGVGTLTTAHIYERLQAMNPDDIDVDARVEALIEWDEYREVLRERFGVLFDAVVKHAEPAYPSPDELRRRLGDLKANWQHIMKSIGRTLRTRQSIEDELTAANCPVRFRELGVDGDRALAAVTWSKDIRNRYTILHLAWELGELEGWADEALELLY